MDECRGAVELDLAGDRPVTQRKRPLALVLHDRSAVLGGLVCGGYALAAIFAPVLAPSDPLLITDDRLRAPSRQHLLGTDELGRDMLSRIIFGSRVTLGAAAVATVLVMTIGLLVGILAGYFGGAVDAVLMRIVDVMLALPGMVLTLAIAGLFKPGLPAVMLGIVTVWWVGYARVVRSLVLIARGRSYIEGVKALGAGNGRIILRHVLPNVMPAVIVLVTLRMGRLILAIAGLSFIGLGAQPPTPEWGAMLSESRIYFPFMPHLMLAPGLTIAILVLGLNLLGDGLRDALDPRLRSAERLG